MTGGHRILVTGAGGFVGSWLIAGLASGLPAGASIVATGRPGEDLARPELVGVCGVALDVTRPAEVDALVASVRPTAVVHLAGIASLVEARAESRRAWDVNLLGTMNMAEAVMRHAPDARFLFAGSSEVYGGTFNAAGGTVDETALLAPRNPYAATKAAADLMLGQMAEAGLRAVRFRPFNHTGPGQSTHFAVPAFAAQIAAAERGDRPAVMRVGNLEARRDFLDVRDVVEAYRLAVLAPDLPPGLVLNLASGSPRRIGDVLDTLLELSRIHIRIELDDALMRPSEVPVTSGDARRARDMLGWQPTFPWGQTLGDVLDSFRLRAS